MTETPHVVAVLGRGVVPADEPVVTADDLGLTRGDGCFDSLRVLTGDDGRSEPRDLDGHLDRLAASAAALSLQCPPRAELETLVGQALDAWTTPGEATLKIVLTRGREWVPGPVTALATISPVHRPTGRPGPPRAITAITLSSGHPSDAFLDAPWLLGGVKTLSYVVNVTARRMAQVRGADEVIFTSTDGYALDGPTAGLLVARDGGLLSTPVGGTGILASTSVAHILKAAAADGRDARYRLVAVEDLYTADGVWLVASSRGPSPVTTLDGKDLRCDAGLIGAVARYAGF